MLHWANEASRRHVQDDSRPAQLRRGALLDLCKVRKVGCSALGQGTPSRSLQPQRDQVTGWSHEPRDEQLLTTQRSRSWRDRRYAPVRALKRALQRAHRRRSAHREAPVFGRCWDEAGARQHTDGVSDASRRHPSAAVGRLVPLPRTGVVGREAGAGHASYDHGVPAVPAVAVGPG